MGVVKTVSSGQPIRAGWANSLVNEVNTKDGLRLRGKAATTTSLRPVKPVSDSAWQIAYNHGTYCINAGQIYINNILITGEENSFNMASSVSDWEKNCKHTPTSKEDLPIWYITIQHPSVVTADNIGKVVAKLVLAKVGEAAPVAPTPNEGEEALDFSVIQLNKIVEGQVLQLVSGAIYINTNSISLVSGDGILVESDTTGGIHTINLYVSFIADDGIEITEGYDPPEETKEEDKEETPATQAEGETETEKKPTHKKKVIRIKNTSIPLSFIGKDGITVTDTIYNYDVSTEEDEQNIWKQSKVITIEHDIKSFIGKDGIVVTEDKWTEEVVTDTEAGTTETIEKKAIIISGGTTTLSFIGKDGITVTDTEGEKDVTDPTTGEVTKEKVRLVEIGGESATLSFIGLDDITVNEYIVNQDVSAEGDEQNIWKQTKVITIENGITSFIGKDGIEVAIQEYEVQTTDPNGQNITSTKKAVVIANTEITKFSFIGKDGITITEEETEHPSSDPNSTLKEKVKKVTIKGEPKDQYEFVGEDGVKVTDEVTEETTEDGTPYNKHTVTIGTSVIADVDVEVRGGNNITVEQTTEGTKQVFTVSSNNNTNEITIKEGEGITVTQNQNQYTISCNISEILYDFDTTWFTVTNNTVTLNEAKLDEVAQGLAQNVSSSITTTSTLAIDTFTDVDSSGDIMATINTTSGETASASVTTKRN